MSPHFMGLFKISFTPSDWAVRPRMERLRGEEADPASIPPQPQTGTRVSTSSSSAALPGLGYRPKVKVFSDEIPGWPRYPDFPSSNLSGYTATSPPTPFANHAVADGQATPTISAVDLQSPPLPHPEHASLAQTDNQVPLNVSTTVAPQIAPPVSAVRPFCFVCNYVRHFSLSYRRRHSWKPSNQVIDTWVFRHHAGSARRNSFGPFCQRI